MFLSCLVQGIFFFFLSCLFRHKPDLTGSQAVPCSIFASSCSCCSWDSQPQLDSWAHARMLRGVHRTSEYAAVPGHCSPVLSPTADPSRPQVVVGSCFSSILPGSLLEPRLRAGPPSRMLGLPSIPQVRLCLSCLHVTGAFLEFQAITLSHRLDFSRESTGPEPPPQHTGRSPPFPRSKTSRPLSRLLHLHQPMPRLSPFLPETVLPDRKRGCCPLLRLETSPPKGQPKAHCSALKIKLQRGGG